MEASAILFYIIAFVILVSSAAAVVSRRILRSAVYLLFSLGGTAVIYFMVDYHFLAAVQLIVYAGGIVVLIIFSILLTSHIHEKLEHPPGMKVILSMLLTLTGFGVTAYTLVNHAFIAKADEPLEFTMSFIGERLLSYGEGGYVLPFEVISILLLAAMIGAIVIAKRTPRKS